jgi:hypothetical protein
MNPLWQHIAIISVLILIAVIIYYLSDIRDYLKEITLIMQEDDSHEETKYLIKDNVTETYRDVPDYHNDNYFENN